MGEKTKKELEFENLKNETIDKGRSLFARKEFEVALIWFIGLIIAGIISIAMGWWKN